MANAQVFVAADIPMGRPQPPMLQTRRRMLPLGDSAHRRCDSRKTLREQSVSGTPITSPSVHQKPVGSTPERDSSVHQKGCDLVNVEDNATKAPSLTITSPSPMINTLLLASTLIISAPVHASSTTNNHNPSLTPANNVQTIEQAQLDQDHIPKTMRLFSLKIARR